MRPYLSIVIPCFNEEKRLAVSFPAITDFIKEKNYATQIVIVNDGSTDKTSSTIKKLIVSEHYRNISYTLVEYKKNKGKGYAIKRGISQCRGKFILCCDADLSTPISELDRLLISGQNYDLVIGSRKQSDANVIKHQSYLRNSLGKIYSWLSKKSLNVDINDFTCGFKLFKNSAAKLIVTKSRIDGWGYDSEFLKIASLNHLLIKEVGIIWQNNEESKVNLMKDVFRSLQELITINVYSFLGTYEK